MDPHLLRTFVAVSRLCSFSEAAAELGYTQSAVSQHIAALEQDLGAALLTRRPVGPTPVGERLLEHAVPLLLRLDAARSDIERLVTAPSGEVALAVSPLAASLERLSAAWRPGRAFTVSVRPRLEVSAAVATGQADLGLVDGLAAPDDPLNLPDVGPLPTIAITQEPVAVLMPPGHPLAGRPGLRLADLAEARWIDATDTAVPLEALRAAVGSESFRPALRYPCTDVLCLLRLVAGGHGLAVLPHRAELSNGWTTAVPVTEPPLVHRTELLHAATLSPAARAAAEALTDG
ncbi:LysR family transcriptional regulator [Actinocorallia longicatena]